MQRLAFDNSATRKPPARRQRHGAVTVHANAGLQRVTCTQLRWVLLLAVGYSGNGEHGATRNWGAHGAARVCPGARDDQHIPAELEESRRAGARPDILRLAHSRHGIGISQQRKTRPPFFWPILPCWPLALTPSALFITNRAHLPRKFSSRGDSGNNLCQQDAKSWCPAVAEQPVSLTYYHCQQPRGAPSGTLPKL